MALRKIIRPRGAEITTALLRSCINEHQQRLARYTRLEGYYLGEHDILRRKTLEHAPNNKLVHPFPRYITNTATGYMFGNPIQYQPKNERADASGLTNALEAMGAASHDAELGKDLSIFGVAYELLYIPDYTNAATVHAALLDPKQAFIVYDDDIMQNPMFGVYLVEKRDAVGNTAGSIVNVFTPHAHRVYAIGQIGDEPILLSEETNPFGVLPMVQYINNEDGRGDFEDVLTLIDAYDVLGSDRVNDKERFVNAILVIKNATLGDDPEAIELMLRGGILELPGEGTHAADAAYLSKTLNETETEVLKKALAMDIHKFSHTPDFTDEQFSGNVSGVAMRFKVLSLEYLAKVKERFFTAGLRNRLRILYAVASLKNQIGIAPDEVNIIFNRTLPNNELEMAQTVATLVGIVSNETLLTQVPFVKDAADEVVKAQAERAGQVQNQLNSLNARMQTEMGR